MTSPLASVALFHIGPAPTTEEVVETWAIMALLVAGVALVTRRMALVASKTQGVFELIVETVDGQIRKTLVPGVRPPTADLETDAALALLVFLAIIWFGVRAGGLGGSTLRPSPRPACSWFVDEPSAAHADRRSHGGLPACAAL